VRLAIDADTHFPGWMPDGQRVTYASRLSTSSGYEFFSAGMDVHGPGDRLRQMPLNLAGGSPLSWSLDGKTAAYVDQGDIWVLTGSGEGEARPFIQSNANETNPSVSPDGRWLAYASDETGRQEIYLRSLTGTGPPYKISTDGGNEPRWAGTELFFRNGDKLMAFTASPQLPFKASRPVVVFTGPFAEPSTGGSFDVFPDGKQFVLLDAGKQESTSQIQVLLNWAGELQRLLPR
jgi:eukaryotic-like serine/threonine-protein kinase